MIELIEQGVPNIVCCQPFACLPNHVVGKGMFREMRRRFPQANIVAIDYDPGASEVNQLNRIKLMISTARMRHDSGSEATLAELLADLGPAPDGTPTSPDVAARPGVLAAAGGRVIVKSMLNRDRPAPCLLQTGSGGSRAVRWASP